MTLSLINFKVCYQPYTKWLSYPDISLLPGCCICINGRSGRGKTTLLNALFQPWFTGKIAYDKAVVLDKDIAQWGKALYKFVSYLPQFAQNGLNPSLTIGEQFALVRQAAGQTADALDDLTFSYMDQLELSKSCLDLYPAEVSGGMKQRIGLAMGFLKKPQLFVLDEPVAALDYITIGKTAVFLQARKAEGCALLLVSHHSGFANLVADTIIELDAGKEVD